MTKEEYYEKWGGNLVDLQSVIKKAISEEKPYDTFKFACWLTAHDEETIRQMYRDFCQNTPKEKVKTCKWKTLGFENMGYPSCLKDKRFGQLKLGKYCPFCRAKIERV